jgi:AcrR family transcriptional regulator
MGTMWRDKEKTREHIKKTALMEFSKRGYSHTTIRLIAEKCDIPFASIYGYFNNKEAIFEQIIKPLLKATDQLLTRLKNPEIKQGKVTDSFIESATEEMVHYIFTFRRQIALSLTGSQGTRYANRRDQIARRLEEIMLSVMSQIGGKKSKPNELIKYRIRIHAFTMLSTIIAIVENIKKKEWTRTVVYHFLRDAYDKTARLAKNT